MPTFPYLYLITVTYLLTLPIGLPAGISGYARVDIRGKLVLISRPSDNIAFVVYRFQYEAQSWRQEIVIWGYSTGGLGDGSSPVGPGPKLR